jgi:hypothetical protein
VERSEPTPKAYRPCPSTGQSIVIAELGNNKGIVLDIVDDAVFIGDAAGPVSGEAMFEEFRFTDYRRGYALSNRSMNGIKIKK